jgi:hypothetical protein
VGISISVTVRITESRLSPGYSASDLGDAVEVSAPGGGKYVLVGYLTSPLRQGTLQEYVLFAIEAPADEYRWSISPPPGGSAVMITTQIGSMSNWYDELGAHDLQVEIVESGTVVATLTLTQEVVPPDPVLENRLGGYRSQLADNEREIGNDLAAYIWQAAAATGPNGVPSGLVTAILIQEMGARGAKRGSVYGELSAKSGDYNSVREDQADRLADEYEYGKAKPVVYPDGAIGPMGPSFPPIPRTIGPGQLGLWTVASIVGAPPLIPWVEADVTGATFPKMKRWLVLGSAVSAFRQLSYLNQVDVFNLARFPKSNVELIARLLAKLKNRTHRWPTTASDDVLADPHLIEIIGSEYRDGPTTTPAASAKPNDNGIHIRKLARGEYLGFDRDLLP